jgi:hypothetical protein
MRLVLTGIYSQERGLEVVEDGVPGGLCWQRGMHSRMFSSFSVNIHSRDNIFKRKQQANKGIQ